LFVFFPRNPEKQDGLQSDILKTLRFLDNFLHRKLKDAWHARNRAALLQFFAYKERQNKIVDVQLCLANEVSQSRGTPQTAWAMHQFSHWQRLRSGADSRKAVWPAAP
jgi:hypothetical protein